jgi:hypothetical protein
VSGRVERDEIQREEGAVDGIVEGLEQRFELARDRIRIVLLAQVDDLLVPGDRGSSP